MSPPRPTTTPKPPTLYFAYGSNLSLTQMKSRCPNSTYYGLGLLQGYIWIINERGYANIIPDPHSDPGSTSSHPPRSISTGNEDAKTAPDTRTNLHTQQKPDPGKQKQKAGKPQPKPPTETSKKTSKVHGLLYTLAPTDESALDIDEGVPFAYTKIQLPITVLSAVPSPLCSSSSSSSASSSGSFPATSPSPSPTSQSLPIASLPSRLSALIFSCSGVEDNAKPQIRALTYIDLHRTAPSIPNPEYIHRMNRGIRDAVSKGMDMSYVRDVMRLYIPETGEEFRDQLRDDVGGEEKGEVVVGVDGTD
ncbi:hypothetical protein EYC80_000484 [Monilinia laxa]|uniref:gamma-glutamylcyclotransferase n=1 Tax=Monilinia laxa TaxID=61186 RepID=A0A5N6KAW1_MONLA|nr:hypothetical protein EYC80_000484 [Monilinia laxa]